MTETSVSAAKLTGFAAACLEKLGLAAADARLVAETLVESNLRGVDSHGVVRLPHYAARLRNGTVNARPRISARRTGASTAIVEGDRGMGQLVAVRAMQEAISLARESGLGAVGGQKGFECTGCVEALLGGESVADERVGAGGGRADSGERQDEGEEECGGFHALRVF